MTAPIAAMIQLMMRPTRRRPTPPAKAKGQIVGDGR
jgi:hypothetical protein